MWGRTFPAHPRSRGENRDRIGSSRYEAGSSPLTRGKLTLDDPGHVMRGLIPAHAGKTRQSCHHARRSPAHPRSRGENGDPARIAISGGGSSPLTRGKPVKINEVSSFDRLIPAHAGKTRESKFTSVPITAHPRSRGENAPTPTAAVVLSGSSPLTRGKHGHGAHGHANHGLIPAHAGKTLRMTPSRRSPRGSSPLTRGKLGVRVRGLREARLIPAHAGKTESHARRA